jgi:AcrR family transcriptional regulator
MSFHTIGYGNIPHGMETAHPKLPSSSEPMPRSSRRPPPRLSPEDWELAALDVLEHDGLRAVTINRLARGLGVTKGSFYWHYKSREDLIVSMLARWERTHTDETIEALAAIEDPRRRVEVLFEHAGKQEPTIHVQLAAAAEDPLVAPVLERITERRLKALTETFREAGFRLSAGRERAALAYATYMGLAHLRREGPARVRSQQGARRLAGRAAAMLLSDT